MLKNLHLNHLNKHSLKQGKHFLILLFLLFSLSLRIKHLIKLFIVNTFMLLFFYCTLTLVLVQLLLNVLVSIFDWDIHSYILKSTIITFIYCTYAFNSYILIHKLCLSEPVPLDVPSRCLWNENLLAAYLRLFVNCITWKEILKLIKLHDKN